MKREPLCEVDPLLFGMTVVHQSTGAETVAVGSHERGDSICSRCESRKAGILRV